LLEYGSAILTLDLNGNGVFGDDTDMVITLKGDFLVQPLP
jgi:hypothetical protein